MCFNQLKFPPETKYWKHQQTWTLTLQFVRRWKWSWNYSPSSNTELILLIFPSSPEYFESQMKLYYYTSNSIRHLLLSDMTHLPRLSVLEETHGTLQWQPDNFEHFCSPWTPIFREPCSTPIFCHRCLFCFHTLSSFQMLFPCFWEKHVRQPGENPAENVTEKEAKAQHWASNSYNIMRFSLFANRCYISEHEYSSIHSSTCPSAQQSALMVIRHRLYCSGADIDPECIAYCQLNTFHNLNCFNLSSIYKRLPSFPSPGHSVMYCLPLYSLYQG